MLQLGCSLFSNSSIKVLKLSSQSSIYLLVLGSLLNNKANATPRKAPNSVSVALSIMIKAIPAVKITPPAIEVFVFSVILLNILFSFQYINLTVQVAVLGFELCHLLRKA